MSSHGPSYCDKVAQKTHHQINQQHSVSVLSILRGFGSTISALKSIGDETPQDLHIRLLAHGIELNLVDANGEQVESLWLEIIKIISLVLDQDQRKMV